jgi:hypothetical protein
MAVVEAVAYTPVELLAELLERGYALSAKTNVRVHDHKVGAHAVTYADELVVAGPEAPPDYLREAMRAYKPELLAAACVMEPPVAWLQVLVRRCSQGRVPVAMLAANVAAFIGLHPAHDRERLEPTIEEALRP